MLGLSRQTRRYSFSFVMDNTDGGAMLAFECGQDRISWTLNHVSLMEVIETGSDRVKFSQPENAQLLYNYPNPFNGSTKIRFRLNQNSQVILKIYDIKGREVDTLVQGWQKKGEQTIQYTADGLATGVYLLRFQTDENTAVRKIMIFR